VHSAFAELIVLLSEKLPHASLVLKTNGGRLHLFNSDILRLFGHIRVSIDATTPDEYAAGHGVKTSEWHRVWSNIRRVATMGGIDVGVSAVLHDGVDERHWVSLEQLCTDNGVRSLLVKPLVDSNSQRHPVSESWAVRHVSSATYVRTDSETGGSIPASVAAIVRHVAADGSMYPCCHVEGIAEWRLAHLGTLRNAEDIIGKSELWNAYGRFTHSCRAFDLWREYSARSQA
jgi:molybdenum cofactor biosynthesis enzyme MoaA